ncbi:MAG: helix-turn-helix transcriptional regulator [Clostridia bacterium]|nr:helix-turn-helix transcriptional regulator [Clostridia bacterium]
MLKSCKWQYNKKEGIQLFMSVRSFDHEKQEFVPEYLPTGDCGWCFEPHSHSCIEVIRVDEGLLHAEIDGHKYTAAPGDILIASPYMEHGGVTKRCDRRTVYTFVMIEPRFFIPGVGCALSTQLNELILGKRRFEEFLPAERESTARLGGLMGRMWASYQEKSPTVCGNCAMMAGGYELLGLLFGEHTVDASAPAMQTRNDPGFADRVMAWIDENYKRSVSTSDICQDLGYTMSHFCRVFHDNFGVSFLSYLCEYRIHRAAYNYRDSGMGVGEIAAAVGFDDCSYFSRTFKKFMRVSPREYFKKK